MRIIYMGTPQFAVPPLRALHGSGHSIIGAVTRVDKPAGRGNVLTPPPVKTAAAELGIPVHQPKRVREPEFIETLRTLAPEVIVVAAYGQILPKDILSLPRHGCINIHASLLPAYRGAAPINWAIIRGEQETGITLMQMDEGLDTGGILQQERIPIGSQDTTGSLTAALSVLGAKMIVEALPRIEAGALRPRQQDHARATLAPILKKEDGRIVWTLSAEEISSRVRGLSPWPGAYTTLDGRLVKLLQAEAVPGSAGPGSLVAGKNDALLIGTGDGLLQVVVLQPEAKRPMTAAEFLRGHRDIAGKTFGSA